MNEKERAVEKLQNEFAKGELKKFGVESVIAEPVKDRLIAFCKESELFARKVLRSVPTVLDCIHSISEPISKEHKSGVSDFEVYASAVKFYCEAANVKVFIEITCTEESEEVGEQEYNEILAKQTEIAENAAKIKAEKAAKEAEKRAQTEAERKKRMENASKKKEQTTQQLSLFDM